MFDATERDFVIRPGQRQTSTATSQFLPEQPYFVALLSYHCGEASEGASIRDAGTGAVTGIVKPPIGAGNFTRVSSLGKGAYLLAASPLADEQRRSSPHRRTRHEVLQAYLLQENADGKAADLRPLPDGVLPRGCRDIACSSNGDMLAYAAADIANLPLTAEVGLIDLSTYQRRAVRSMANGTVGALSWAGDNRTLAFEWNSVSGFPASGIYVADIYSGDWLSQSTVVNPQNRLGGDVISPVISADGQAVYATVAQPEPAGGLRWTRLVEIPIGRGQPQTLFELRYEANSYNLHYMWELICRDRLGRYLLVFTTGYVYRVEISSGTITRLPFPEGRPYAAAW